MLSAVLAVSPVAVVLRSADRDPDNEQLCQYSGELPRAL